MTKSRPTLMVSDPEPPPAPSDLVARISPPGTCLGCGGTYQGLCEQHCKCPNCHHPLFTSRNLPTWEDCPYWAVAHHVMQGCCQLSPYQYADPKLRPRARELLLSWAQEKNDTRMKERLDALDKELAL
jgi:hypothetical protein